AGNTAIFAVSSVSGGSLGAAAYIATLAGQPPGACTLAAGNRGPFRDASVAALGRDALGPALAGSLFGDIPRALLYVPGYLARRVALWLLGIPYQPMRGGDRAEALERAFAANWAGVMPASLEFTRPFLSLAYDGS